MGDEADSSINDLTNSFYDLCNVSTDMSRLTEGGVAAVQNRQSRHWAFTSWQDDAPRFNRDVMDYMCYQREKTEEGKEHWQGYVMLPGYGQRLNVVKRLLGPGVHVEPKRPGTTKHQVREYTRKEESAVPGTWAEFGNFDEKGAHSANPDSDYTEAIKMIMAGSKMSEVAEKYPKTVAKNHAGFKALQFQQMLGGKPEDVPKTVKVFWGETRTGKTFAAKKYVDEHHAGSTYWLKSSKNNLWFDGYERDSCIVIDDFEGQMSVDNFLHLTDRYAGRHTWQIKGGHTRLYHNTVIITSNTHPQQWFRDEHPSKKAAAMARLTSIEHFLHFPMYNSTPLVFQPMPTCPKPMSGPFKAPQEETDNWVSKEFADRLDKQREEIDRIAEEEEKAVLADVTAYQEDLDMQAEADKEGPSRPGTPDLEIIDFPVTPPPLMRCNAVPDAPRKKPLECKKTSDCKCWDCVLGKGSKSLWDGSQTVADVLARLRQEDSYNDKDYGKAPYCRR